MDGGRQLWQRTSGVGHDQLRCRRRHLAFDDNSRRSSIDSALDEVVTIGDGPDDGHEPGVRHDLSRVVVDVGE